jgi:hypothetical protein
MLAEPPAPYLPRVFIIGDVRAPQPESTTGVKSLHFSVRYQVDFLSELDSKPSSTIDGGFIGYSLKYPSQHCLSSGLDPSEET